jgi:hypothetical protein
MKTNTSVLNKFLTASLALVALFFSSVVSLATPPKILTSGETSASTSGSYQNVSNDNFGGGSGGEEKTLTIKGPTYEDKKTYGSGNVTGTQTTKIENELSISRDENGAKVELKIGIESVLEGVAKKQLGNDNLGLTGEVAGKLEAALKGEGMLGACVDDKGLTIGGRGQLGATLGVGISTTATLNILGVDTSVKLIATGQVGASVEGAALITIGKDGKIKFAIGGGATVGIGGNVRMEFEVSAEKLMEKLGLKNISQLIEWVMKVSQNSKELLKELFGDENNTIIDIGKIMETLENIGKIKDMIWGNLPGVNDPGTGTGTKDKNKKPVSLNPIKTY